jgi:exosortase
MLGAALLLVAVVWLGVLFYPAVVGTFQLCWDNPDYSHGLLLPVASLYILYDRWPQIRRLASSTPKASTIRLILGVLVLLSGLGLGTISLRADLLFGQWVSLFVTLAGVCILALSAELRRLVIGPLLLIYMARPIPEAVIPKLFGPLQTISAKASEVSLDILGVPVFSRGNVIELPGLQLMVEEACSGLRSTMALVTTALIVLSIIPMSLMRKVVLVVASVVIAVVLNIFRVVITGLLAHFYDPASATGFFHEFTGMIVFVLGLGFVYGFARLMERVLGKSAVSV